jgi:hypothetical protein
MGCSNMFVFLCRAAQVDSCQPACEPSWILNLRRVDLPYFYNRHTLYGSPIRELESDLYYTPDAPPLLLHSMAGRGSNNIGRIRSFWQLRKRGRSDRGCRHLHMFYYPALRSNFFSHNSIIVQKGMSLQHSALGKLL